MSDPVWADETPPLNFTDAAAQKVADFYREYYRRLRGSDHDDNHDDGGGNATPDDGDRAPHAPLPRLSVNGEGALTRER